MNSRSLLGIRLSCLCLSLGLTGAACSNSDSGLDNADGGLNLTEATPSLLPTVQSFGRVTPGMTSAVFKFALSNVGSMPTGTVALSVDGANATDFQVMSSTCGAPLPRNGGCEIGIVFAPNVAGTKSANLKLKMSPGGTVSATLGGIAQVPSAAILSPSQFDFGPLLASSATNPATPSTPAKGMFMLSNTGGPPVGPFAIDLAGKDAADFAVTDSSTCASSLAPATACMISVSFRPATPGVKGATLTATSSDGALKLSAALSGIGTDRAMLVLTPPTLALDPKAVGMTSSNTFRLQNTGGVTTGKISYALTGANFSEFSVDTSACETLNPGDACTLTVVFAPTQPGGKSATFRADATPGGSVSSTISASAVSGMLSVTSAGAEPFGTVPVGRTSTAAFIVENKGIGSAGKVLASITANNLNEFTVTENLCPATLDAAAACIVTVSFTPQATGVRTGLFQASAMPGGFTSLALSATAVDGATLEVTPATRNFGNFGVNAGNSVATIFTVTNTGETLSGPLAVALEGTDAGNFNLSFTDCPAVTLQKDRTCRVEVRFNPLTVGNKIASLAITAAPGGIARASLYGNGN